MQHRPAALRVPLPTQRRVARAGLGRSVPGCPPAPCRLRALRCAVPWRPLPAAAELRLGAGGCRGGPGSACGGCGERSLLAAAGAF